MGAFFIGGKMNKLREILGEIEVEISNVKDKINAKLKNKDEIIAAIKEYFIGLLPKESAGNGGEYDSGYDDGYSQCLLDYLKAIEEG